MKTQTRNIHHIHKTQKKRLPLSGIILAILLLSTFLTVLVAEQQQESRSKAQQTPIQQACLPGATLTKPEAGKLEPFCTQFPEAATCKDFCKRTSDGTNNSTSALCQPGGVYHCEAGSGKPEKGKCQQGACTTSPRVGMDNYCGGGGTCCEPPKPVGGACTKKEDCVTGLECTANKCAPVAPKGPPQDIDGDGKQNDQDDDIDGDGQPNAQDPDADGDGKPNQQDQQPNGMPGAPPPPVVAPPGGGNGGGAACGPTHKARSVPIGGKCATSTECTVDATCRSCVCQRTVPLGTCTAAFCKSINPSYVCNPNGTCGAPQAECRSDAQCKSKNADFICGGGGKCVCRIAGMVRSGNVCLPGVVQ